MATPKSISYCCGGSALCAGGCECQCHLLVARFQTVVRLADELCEAVDREGEDIGGSRGSLVILRELGPAVDKAKVALRFAPTSPLMNVRPRRNRSSTPTR
jgi:hypothetical protein